MKQRKNFNPERSSFLALMLLVTLVGFNTCRNWPTPAIIEDARAEFSRPFDTSQLAEDYTLTVSGRNPLVPPAVEFSREYNITTRVVKRPKKPTVTRPVTTVAPNPNANYVMLPSKNKVPTIATSKTDDKKDEKKPFPVKIKGIANFPGLGYRLVITDQDGKYARLSEGDEWEKDGERLQIRKIAPTKVIFLDGEGKVHTLEFDIMGMRFDSEGVASTVKPQKTAQTTKRPSEQPQNGQKPGNQKPVGKNKKPSNTSTSPQPGNTKLPDLSKLSDKNKSGIKDLLKRFLPDN